MFLGYFPGRSCVLLKLRLSVHRRNTARNFILKTNKTNIGLLSEFSRMKKCQQDVVLGCSQLP